MTFRFWREAIQSAYTLQLVQLPPLYTVMICGRHCDIAIVFKILDTVDTVFPEHHLYHLPPEMIGDNCSNGYQGNSPFLIIVCRRTPIVPKEERQPCTPPCTIIS